LAAVFFSGGQLTFHQTWALEYASALGTSYYAEPFPADYRYVRTLQAALITESSLCCHKRGIDPLAYGCGQSHRATAHEPNHTLVSVRTLKHPVFI